MERRKFLNLASFGLVGAAAPSVAVAAASKKTSNYELDGPICSETLQIQSGTKIKQVKKSQFGDISFFGDKYEEHKQVAMAVGRDGNLWLKTEDGKWKRIVTE